MKSLGLEYVTGTGSDIPADIWGRDLPASEIAPVANQPAELEQSAAQSTVSAQPTRARNESAPVEAEDPEDSETDSDSDPEFELLTVDRLQQWARELEQEKNWETDIAVFQATRKGERESQNQTAGDSAKSIAKKDTDAKSTAELVEQDSKSNADCGSENDDSNALFDTRTKEGLEQERAELEKQRVELWQDRKGWLTLAGIYNAIMKGDRAGQNQTVGNGAKSIVKKDGDAEPTA